MKSTSFLLIFILILPNFVSAQAGEMFDYYLAGISVSPLNPDSLENRDDSTSYGKNEGLYRDSWTSRDKFYHLFVSAALSGGGYWALEAANNREDQSAAACFSITVCIGGIKEIYDYHHPGHHASWKDLTADVIGAALGIFIAWSL